MNNKIKFMILSFFVALVMMFLVSGQAIGSDDFSGSKRGTASYVNYGSSFNRYYGSEASTYWPILNNKDECTARQDILVQISPVGCQPAVVRSDLLAEQNVPVFCQLDLLQINPAIDVKQIRNMRFKGNYPSYVSGVGFHPARAALRTRDRLLGSPLQSNIGYVVVVLKRSPQEKDLPDFFNFTLSATVDYYSGNAIGLGVTELLLSETNDQEWETAQSKQSFFRGKYSVRLLESEVGSADIALYRGDEKTNEITLNRQAQQQNQVYLPGSYCQTALQFSYSDFASSQPRARIQVDEDLLEVYDGARFLDNKCLVRRVYGDSINGTVELSCGRDRIVLFNSANLLSIGSKIYKVDPKNFLFKSDEEWIIKSIDSKTQSYNLERSTDPSIKGTSKFGLVRPVEQNALIDATYADYETFIQSSIKEYENVADSYGNERELVESDVGETLGERAFLQAINLAIFYEKKKTAARLIEKYLIAYPNGEFYLDMTEKLNGLYTLDSSSSGRTIEADDGFHSVKLLDVYSPIKKSNVLINWGGQELAVNQGETTKFNIGFVTLVNIRDAENAEINVACNSEINNSISSTIRGGRVNIRLGDSTSIVCGNVIRTSRIDVQRYVKLRIAPVTKTSTTSNFTVGIGIEKRAIELTPSKAQKKIDNLNKTIKTWESISGNLGNVVKGLKGACFATAGVLTVKNFFTGLSGEALARKDVMRGDNGWTKFCENAVNNQQYQSLTECYNDHSSEIGNDVDARTLAIKNTNKVTEEIEGKTRYPNREGLFAGTSFDDVEARRQMIDRIKQDCGTESLGPRSGNISSGYSTVGSLFPSGTDPKAYSYTQLRDIYFNCQTIKNGGSAQGALRARTEIDSAGFAIGERLKYEERVGQYRDVDVYVINNKNRGHYSGSTVKSLKDKGFNNFGALSDETPAQVVAGRDKTYLVTFEKIDGGYKRKQIYALEDKTVGSEITTGTGSSILTGESDLQGLPTVFDLNNKGTYYYSFASGQTSVRYFETEPYKGMPAIVPFDLNRGFYAATTQSLPILGKTKSFEDNGKPSSFFVCNIMKDRLVGFYSPNYGDDECVQFNVYTGQPFTNFPGVSESDTKKLVSDAIRALEEAAQQYGKKSVRIRGNTLAVGNAAALVPGTQCQDHMSPADCKLLFNVCDPVICPASRCNFGGSYQVADVIQSGIVGSALLCLPNYKEGIVLPVCLTGLQAGIDGYLSILKSHQQCLQEAIDTGQYVGICDQINSIYLCEFFWRQAAPLAGAILPKVVEYAYNGGQNNVRGGGEYLTVQESWKNAEDSVKYFTQSYAVNSIEAFQIRSIEEAGTPFCKAFISAKGPKTFESLIEPDSPPQFHSWFSSIPFTEATVPATAQYKVFYHIFAGKDRGVSYSVYLKDPPTTVQYSSNPFVVVATGFVARGGYATETRDFTAPAGYKQLCVRINDKEECGFKQVSSSFAVNYVRDSIVSDELTRKDITTESQCVSGSFASPTSLLNPNLQEGVQEAIDPAIYNRGIVRICATSNPGTGTDPSRFVKVGVCGDQRLGCWLDKKSIDRAITDDNIGAEKTALNDLNRIQRENLLNDTSFDSPDEIGKKLAELKEKIERKNPLFDNRELPSVVKALDELNLRTVFNNDRAKVLFWKAYAYEKAFRNIVDTIRKTALTPEVASITGPSSSGEPIANATTVSEFAQLETVSKPSDRAYLIVRGTTTSVYVQGNNIYLGSTRIGSTLDGTFDLLDSFRDDLLDDLGEDIFTILDESAIEQLRNGIGLPTVTTPLPVSNAHTVKLDNTYTSTSSARNYFILDGVQKPIYILGNNIYFDDSSTPIGSILNSPNGLAVRIVPGEVAKFEVIFGAGTFAILDNKPISQLETGVSY